MSAQMTFDPKTSRVVAKTSVITSPLAAIGWLAFTVLLLISPALVWAGWKLLL